MRETVSSAELPNNESGAPPLALEMVIDWSLAQPLSTTGTTCETFLYEYNCRRIFLKRLKEDKRYNALYRDSIRKEFEIGRRLEHPALPNYESEHGDTWLSTRYVDGHTLSDLIAEHSPWLAKAENVRKLLSELLDVVAYLHSHGVTHCDIHGGNVMLDRTHTVKLIDLGLCYTDWATKSSVHPSELGMEKLADGSPLIDFRMIGSLAQRIVDAYPALPCKPFIKFIEACTEDDVNEDTLQNILKESPKPRRRGLWLWLAFGIIAAGVSYFFIFHQWVSPMADSVTATPDIETPALENPTVEPPTVDAHISAPLSDPHALLRARLAAELPAIYKPLDDAIVQAIAMVEDENISDSDILDAQSRIIEISSNILQQLQQRYGDEFPAMSSAEIHSELAKTAVFESYSRRINEVSAMIMAEMKRRHPLDYD